MRQSFMGIYGREEVNGERKILIKNAFNRVEVCILGFIQNFIINLLHLGIKIKLWVVTLLRLS